jgi:hypothetical protein
LSSHGNRFFFILISFPFFPVLRLGVEEPAGLFALEDKLGGDDGTTGRQATQNLENENIPLNKNEIGRRLVAETKEDGVACFKETW